MRRATGFTLIELMVAIVVTGVVALLVYGVIGVAVDTQGRVYIACGQVRVFSPGGQLIDVIDVPQRPTGLVFGGEDRKTLFIHAMYVDDVTLFKERLKQGLERRLLQVLR